MPLKMYERLSRVYDLDWRDFSLRFACVVSNILSEYGIQYGRILDLACGTGTMALELARKGHVVHGIDSSPEMLAFARTKSKSTGMKNITFENRNMTDFSVQDSYDLATCIFDSINYILDVKEVKSMFTCVRECLKQDGLLLIDSTTNKFFTSFNHSSYAYQFGEERFVQKLSYDRRKRQAITVFEFFDGEIETHEQRPYDLWELKHVLKGEGYRIVHVFSRAEKRKYDFQKERLIFLAQKRG
jgi:2-polyprenyl-3-methyl-5-hydroxy-6-metoxy-1,4-benzoquinol methylase